MQFKYLIAALAAAATHVAAEAAAEAEPNALAEPAAAPEPVDLPDIDIDLLDKRQNIHGLTWSADDVPENNPRFQAYDRWTLNRFNSRQGLDNWNRNNRNRNWYGDRNRYGNRGRVAWRWCAHLRRYDWC